MTIEEFLETELYDLERGISHLAKNAEAIADSVAQAGGSREETERAVEAIKRDLIMKRDYVRHLLSREGVRWKYADLSGKPCKR